jgi:cell division septation protein DedD
MQFLKKNYEKIILGVVVLAALGIVAFLPILVSREKQSLDEMENQVLPNKPKALDPLDLSREDTFLSRSKTVVTLDLSRTHKVFNPVRFQLQANGNLLRNPAGTEVERVLVTKISPLMETYSLASVTVTPGLKTHYGIGIKHDAAASTSARNMKTTYAEMNQTTNNFTVIAAEGPEEDPTSVKLKLTDTGETVTLTKDKPYQRPEGYIADLTYPPENKNFPNRRKTDQSNVCFAGECYKIVDIQESEVVLLQLSNQKQYTRPLNQTNSAPASTP